jgi:hypothetical protein
MTIKRITLSVLVAGVCAGGWVAVASGDDASTTAAAPAAAPAPESAPPFGVFRRPARAGDAMPAETRRILSVVADREGVSLDAARAVAPSGTGSVWVIPGPGKACVAIPDPVDGFGMNCADTDAAKAGKLWVTLVGLKGQQAGDARVAMVVPDGVDSVTASSAHGAHSRIAVSDNVAFGDVSDSDAMEFTDADGAAHAVHVPGTPAALVAQG